MAHNPLVITEIGYNEQPFAYAGVDEQGFIVPEKWDRGLDNVVTATSYCVRYKSENDQSFTQMAHSTDIRLETYVTDSRVIFRCEKYDKGGGWYGGPSALILNTGSKIMAAHRRKGKIMVGHVRYEWLNAVMFQHKLNWTLAESIKLLYSDNQRNTWVVELYFKKGIDAEFLANNILHRAAKYRLEMKDEKGAKEIEFFTHNAQSGAIAPAADPKRQYSSIVFPNHYFAPMGEDKRPDW